MGRPEKNHRRSGQRTGHGEPFRFSFDAGILGVGAGIRDRFLVCGERHAGQDLLSLENR